MNSRQKQILSILIDDYIQEARPISSGFLVSRHQLGFSPATVRNELADLLGSGYLKKIYFSSGSVPTNKAYRLKVEEAMVDEPKERSAKESDFSSLAEAVSFLSATFGTLTAGIDDGNNLFLDGIDELFGQPDFSSRDQYVMLGHLVECLQERGGDFFKTAPAGIFVGRDNPFWRDSDDLSWLVGSVKSNNAAIVTVGPTRMPYKKNWHTFCGVLNNLQNV